MADAACILATTEELLGDRSARIVLVVSLCTSYSYTRQLPKKGGSGDGLVVRHAVQREEEYAVGAAGPLAPGDPAD